MALVEAARTRDRQADELELTGAFQAHPALWLLALFLLILPAFASNFVLIEIFGWAMILGMIALSLMFLAGYGGMVSLVQMTVAGCAGYMVAIFGTSAITDDQPRLAVVARRAGRDRDRGDLRNAARRARGAHRGHLHHHDHARDRVGVLLLHAAELHDLQRLLGLQRGAHAAGRSASTGARRCRSTT